MSQQSSDLSKLLSGVHKSWLVTGAAGFIGSHLTESLLLHDQRVVAIDNFETGLRENLELVRKQVGDSRYDRFSFLEGDIRDFEFCRRAVSGCDVVLHQAALGSVPRSVADPLSTHHANVSGFLNILIASRDAGIKRIVYASSSSVYGDNPDLPKTESSLGQPLSPYAVSKRTDELYAEVFAALYDLEIIGLRYFNVFGPRQRPDGPYAAVIPRWMGELAAANTCTVFGDGETSRDFSYISNVVQANVRAALSQRPAKGHLLLNICGGSRTTLNQLYSYIRDAIAHETGQKGPEKPEFKQFRAGDVRHSLGDYSLAQKELGYVPDVSVEEGIKLTAQSFRK